jgi:hypothetical protein
MGVKKTTNESHELSCTEVEDLYKIYERAFFSDKMAEFVTFANISSVSSITVGAFFSHAPE